MRQWWSDVVVTIFLYLFRILEDQGNETIRDTDCYGKYVNITELTLSNREITCFDTAEL